MRRLQFLVLFMLLVPMAPYAGSGAVVEKDAFQFRLPADWAVLSKDENKNFWIVNFSNSKSDVIQLLVSKKLGAAKFATAKRNLKAGMGRDKSKVGWRLLRSATIELAPFGQVDEEIYLATQGDLTSASYNIYGNSHVAHFTFTLNRNAPNIATAVRPLLSGFLWK